MSLLFTLFILSNAYGLSLSAGNMTENFSDLSHYDKTQSTGVWSVSDQALIAPPYLGGNSNNPLLFGDGSDGALDSSTGYVFDTNTHPNGFNFTSVNISGGTISVTGTQPLVIRSMGDIVLASTLSVKGGNGTAGTANGSTTGPTGGQSIAGKCSGGRGGTAAASSTGDGGGGLMYDTTEEPSGGLAGSGGTSGQAGIPGTDGPLSPTTWETTNQIRCGAGGGGGGGHINGGNHATGASGGAGGGTVRLIALGKITYTTIDASGGDGAQGANDGQCSGSSAGGNGGAIWLQSFKTVTGSNLTVAEGTPGGGCVAATSGLAGLTRVDQASTSTAGASFATAFAASNQTYTIQTTSYDLGIQNPGFPTLPTITSTLNGGTVSVSYAGSADNVQFTNFSDDISSLSNKGYRYLKLKFTLKTAATAGASPQIKSISIPFEELNIQLNGGCGSLDTGSDNKSGPQLAFMWLAILWVIYTLSKKQHSPY